MVKQNMKEILQMIKEKEKENIILIIAIIIQVNGKMIMKMEKEFFIMRMDKLNMREILLKENIIQESIKMV